MYVIQTRWGDREILLRHGHVVGVGAARWQYGSVHVVARPEPRCLVPCRLHHSGQVQSQGERRLAEHAHEPGAPLPVGRVDPGGTDPYQHLTGTWHRPVGLYDLQDLRTAKDALADRPHTAAHLIAFLPHWGRLATAPSWKTAVPVVKYAPV